MKPIVYHAEASRELIEAASFCETERRGRGSRLLAMVARAERQIRIFPRAGSKFESGTRRLVLSRFPYFVIYLPAADRCFVVAVAHAKRKPGYWRERLE
jgi:plasmid stabilization system protein ParE